MNFTMEEDKESNLYWLFFEQEHELKVPLYIRNLFKIGHYDNISFLLQAAKKNKEFPFEEIENLAKSEFYKECILPKISSGQDPKDFYGLESYYTNSQNFRVLWGDRWILNRMIDLGNQLSIKSFKAFKQKKKPGTPSSSFNANFEREKIVESLKNHSFPEEHQEKLYKSIVTVIDNETATIKCTLCDQRPIRIKSHCKGNGLSWNLSNFSRHVGNFHTDQESSEGEDEEDERIAGATSRKRRCTRAR